MPLLGGFITSEWNDGEIIIIIAYEFDGIPKQNDIILFIHDVAVKNKLTHLEGLKACE